MCYLAAAFISKLHHAQVVGAQLCGHAADDSLVAGLEDSEVAAELLDTVHCLPHVVHRDVLSVLISSQCLEKSQTLLLLQEAAVLFPRCDAYIDYLNLHEHLNVNTWLRGELRR